MNTPNHSTDLELAKRHLYRLPVDAREVTVRAGTLWITQGEDPSDIILEPGESFRPDGHRDVVLYALAPASFSVKTSVDGQARVPRGLARLSTRSLVTEQEPS